MQNELIISLSQLDKSFGSNHVLKGVSIDVYREEKLVVIGRSGCGKSVLIKHIVGLLQPDSGSVTVFGKDISKISVKELFQLRLKFGYLFQGAALFDSMTVGENVALPLVENFKLSKKEIGIKVAEKLDLVGLPNTEKLKPAELSGGMKKRVGLARSIVTNPEVILYDEPTTGLDPIMSDSIDNLINRLSDHLKVTSIVITHDMDSVKAIASRVIMLHQGLIHFEGTAEDLNNSEHNEVVNFVNRISTVERELKEFTDHIHETE